MKRVTSAEIAKRAGVSNTAVSFVLNGGPSALKVSKATRERILAIARELNYVPNALARTLRRQRSDIIGIIFQDLRFDYAHRALTGINSVLNERGFSGRIAVTMGDPECERQAMLSFMAHRVDGILADTPFPCNEPVIRDVMGRGTPVVMMGDTFRSPEDLSYVVWDEAHAAETALQHLADTGRRRIALLYPAMDDAPERMQHAMRLNGFTQAVQSPPFETGACRALPVTDINLAETINHLLADPEDRPDALLVVGEDHTLQAMEHLDELGLEIPEDLALMSFGAGPEICIRRIGLSSLQQPVQDIGFESARGLLALIDSTSAPKIRHRIQRAQVEARYSTRARLSAMAATGRDGRN